MKIAIGSDHAGFEYKTIIKDYLESNGHEVEDFGTYSEQSVDYPDFIHPVAMSVSDNVTDFGIVICGSGNGAVMTANKHSKIRAALCWNAQLSHLARKHNNANILGIPERFVSHELAIEMVKVFLSTDFEAGRHEIRVKKIPC
ncbi:ribose 5-phosphate isomerase B [Ichthyobacterium seriolicida]|uniref:Ribose 5-phosphate isomerase B n=1 Tax=Ichthyobacterium seriolicida TaxID=242600 RepID=A0A1J1E244_9FLAO|nr:ribose 5-phosphate isomerase B [Ichthyobacterium seriolicida]BAV94108.1 ribose 5-phosphate isomerase B [Ichthyobacterium seriolicida]